MSDAPYRACQTSKDFAPYVYGVEGPGSGFGFYAWLGYPQNTFDTLEGAEKAARMMNIAFREGQRKRSSQIMGLLNE